VTYDGSYDDPLWDADAEDDDLDADDDLHAEDIDAEAGVAGPGFRLADLGGGIVTSVNLPVTNQVSARFTVACWTVIISLVLGIITGYAIGMSARPHPVKAYHPAPWSCASVLAKLSVIDGGGAIAPVCGQTPYPEVTP